MVRILNKIKTPITDGEVSNINLNFDRIALDLSDRSGTFSTTATVPGGITVLAAQGHSLEVSVVDNQNIYQRNSLPVIPRVDVYIDNDLDGSYLWPVGSNISASLKNSLSVVPIVARTLIDPIDDEKATITLLLQNFDALNHTFYVYVDAYYVPAPDYGIATRDQ